MENNQNKNMISEKTINSLEQPLNTKEKILNDFNEFRYKFIDDIPNEILQPDMPNYHLYKCRMAFFGFIASHLVRLQREGIKISDEAIKKCKEFDDFTESLRDTYRRITKEDIDKANKILDIMISELS